MLGLKLVYYIFFIYFWKKFVTYKNAFSSGEPETNTIIEKILIS